MRIYLYICIYKAYSVRAEQVNRGINSLSCSLRAEITTWSAAADVRDLDARCLRCQTKRIKHNIHESCEFYFIIRQTVGNISHFEETFLHNEKTNCECYTFRDSDEAGG